MRARIAYLMSRFPKISETFIMTEILELQKLGAEIEIFPLVRHHERVCHPEIDQLLAHTHYVRLLSFSVVFAQFYWLCRRPAAYLRAWWEAIRGNWKSAGFLLRALFVVPQAAEFARRMLLLKIQCVHCHWATHPALAAYVVKHLANIPYSFTAHAHDIYANRTMLREKIREARFVVTISEYNRKLLQDLYGNDAAQKLLVIHCGVDPETFVPSNCRTESRVFRIVCIASLEQRKGHVYLLDACARLKLLNIPFRCLLIGDGEEHPRLESQIRKLGLKKHVELLGWQSRDQVRRILHEADVVVLPSIVTESGRTEGIPVSIMEAMAMQVPVIATNISGIPELVQNGETGLIVPERDVSALEGALLRLHAHPPLAAALARNGRNKVLKEFNLKISAAALYAHLKGESVVYEMSSIPQPVEEPVSGGMSL